MLRNEIKNILKKVVGEEAKVEYPITKSHGDYATNIAMKVKKDPKKIIEKIGKNKLFEKVEANRGFINFFISKEYLQSQVKEILKQAHGYGELSIGKKQKVQVEFVSANPTGPLTVGNARGGPFGDVLANVLQKAGYQTEKAYYVNDCGKQIQALGHSVLKDSEAVYKGKYIDQIKVKQKDASKAGKEAADIIIEKYIKKVLEKIGIFYDAWYYESDLKKYTISALKELQDLIYKKDGAEWFKSSVFGDEKDRVVVKSDGQLTYLAGDLGLHKKKFEKFDRVINIWGADHHGDVAGLMAGVEALGHKGKLEIILIQFVTLLKKGKKVKMSKRQGNIVELEELVDEVGKDVVRFFFLQRGNNTHINFDLDLAKEKSNNNPVYYVQYAHARISSILKRAKGVSKWDDRPRLKRELLTHSSELGLIKQLIKLPEVIEDTAKDYQTQRLTKYSQDVATAFHKFYADCRVLPTGPGDVMDPELTRVRLALISASKVVLKNILDIMGISAPEKM